MGSPPPVSSPLKGEEVKYLECSGGRKLAYYLTPGATPGVVFLGGFKSDMTGSKATALEAFCKQRGQRFLRFDYTGHGQSSGTFEEGTIGAWKQDALDILSLVPGKNILVGSSMGAWIALLVARANPQLAAAMVGIASAPDFTEKLVWQAFTSEQKQQMQKDGRVIIPDCYGAEPYSITKQLVEEGRNHLLLEREIPIDVPVRLIHGTKDADVPWQMAVTLMEKLRTKDVSLKLIKDGNHRLSEPAQLEAICRLAAGLL